jgi:hypothetical protein
MQVVGMRARLLELFRNYDDPIQEIVADVLAVEQEYLSMKKPKGAKVKVDDIVDRVARDETGQH